MERTDGPLAGRRLKPKGRFSELVVELGVLIAEQDDQGPDAEGGSKRELEQAEDGCNDGDHAAPLGVLHQAPAGCDGQRGAQHQEDPDKLEQGGAKPHGRHVPMHPGAKAAGEECLGKGEPGRPVLDCFASGEKTT